MGCDFEIVCRKGKKNGVSYAISRRDEVVESLHYAISIMQTNWIIEARDEWTNYEVVWKLTKTLQQDPNAFDSFIIFIII